MANHAPSVAQVGLPPRIFLYTLDQIAGILEIEVVVLRRRYIHFDGRTIGIHHKRERMIARNIAPPGDKPEWRVAEQELLRWMKVKGFRFLERGWLKA